MDRLQLRPGDIVTIAEHHAPGRVLRCGAGYALVRCEDLNANIVAPIDRLSLTGLSTPDADPLVWAALESLVNLGIPTLPASVQQVLDDLLHRIGEAGKVGRFVWCPDTTSDLARQLMLDAAERIAKLGSGPCGIFTAAATELVNMAHEGVER